MPKIAEHQYSQQVSTAAASSDRYRPVLLECLKTYTATVLRADIVAGIIVGIVALPLSIALAIAVGAPPQAGLYTAIVGGGVAALFGGSRTQVTGPTAAFIVILAPIYAQHGPLGLMAAGLLAGGMLIFMGVTGLGSMIRYVPYPVTTGFTTGIAVTIAAIQIKDLFGLKVQYEKLQQTVQAIGPDTVQITSTTKMVEGLPDHFHEKVMTLYHGFGETLPQTVLHTGVISALTLAVLILYPRHFAAAAKRVPGPLVAVLASVAAVFALDHFLGWQDIATIKSRFGAIPRGLPEFNSKLFTELSWSYDSIRPLILPAVAIAALGAIESLLSAVVADGLAGTKHNSNNELIGQGLANVASPLFGGIAATGAIARTATNIKNGGQTPIASIIHACTLLLIMLAAAPYVAYIPMAALGSILLIVAYNMADLNHFRHLLRAPRPDTCVLFACFLLTVFTDMVIAVVAGMLLATVLFMRRMSEMTRVDALSSVAGDPEMASHDLEVHDIPPNVMIYSVDGPFFFGASEKAIIALESLGDDSRVVIMRLNRVPTIDATGLYALEKVYEHLSARGVTLILSKVLPQPRLAMAKTGLLDKVGAENIVPDIEWALARCYEIQGPSVGRQKAESSRQ